MIIINSGSRNTKLYPTHNRDKKYADGDSVKTFANKKLTIKKRASSLTILQRNHKFVLITSVGEIPLRLGI